jgi:FtsP/CotA-like multicopper oxidase with cupredoxin domain
LSRKFPTNISTIPPEIFDVCTSTNASSEVFTINKQPNTAVTWASFDLIGAFGVITAAFSIDGYSMYIYAVDGNYITPQPVEAVQLANGDRYSIMIKLDKPGDYTMRTASLTMPKMFTGLATISYRDKTTSAPLVTNATSFLNDVGRNTSASVRFFDQSKMKAFPPRPIAQYANQTFKLAMRQVGTSYDWALNNTVYPMSLDDQAPLLFQPSPGRYNNVTITTLNNTWVDIIFQAVDYPMPPHPIHKHSNKMFLLGQGFGTFPWNTVAEAAQVNPSFFNFVDPPRRDGFVTPPAVQGPSWMAIRYHVVNPGAWLLHCHVQSHLRGGMSIAMQDGVDEWPTVPREYLDAR